MHDNALFGVLDYSDFDGDEEYCCIHMKLDKFMNTIQKSAIEQYTPAE